MTDLNDFEDCYSQNTNLYNSNDSQGFDVHAGQTWTYPTNYPVREYQFNIIQKALFENTLVSLPTGLGKTFIAAVVMFNFFRWYPNGKVVFIAPTRPLVKQQIDACYNIMAIPQETTIELTGTKEKKSRAEIWNTKRVFFVTPQILQNDLQTTNNLGSKIRCIIFDEAHKAKGNHAYCEVIRKLILQNKVFRVLALSATPGNNPSDMKEVIQNLLISHLEFRTEESPDVSPYVFQRSINTVVVPLDSKLQQVKNDYMEVLERYTRCLINYKVIQGNCCTLTKGKIFMTLKNFQEKNKSSGHPNYSEIMKNLNICVTLYHAYELLVRHGLRSFLSFFEDHINKPLLRGNMNIIQIMEDIKNYLGTLTIAEPLPDGTHTKIPDDIKFGHPKFYKLEEILVSHFAKLKDSRIIVFFEYRESVKEAYTLLLKNTPIIRPRIFLGQGSGVTQRVQLQVVEAFREGKCNTLLSTCIGEEGLDIGEVDLIVCFDISSKSPIRMIQRMGRTGRKREGSVIILVTEGKEQQTLQECLSQKKYMSSNLFALPELTESLYTKNPRMIPDEILPKCEKVYITVQKKNVVKKNMNLKDMLRRKYSDPVYPDQDDPKFKPVVDVLPPTMTFWNKSNPLEIENDETKIHYCKNIDANRKLQYFNEICHSRDTEILVNLLQIADSKRFNIPITQYESHLPQTTNLKQGDIRSIFKKVWDANELKASQEASLEKPTQLEIISDKSECQIPDEIYNEIFNYLTIKDMSDDKCQMCSNLYTCPELPNLSKQITISDWVQPNLGMLGLITKNTFVNRNRLQSSKFQDTCDRNNLINTQIKMEIDTFVLGMSNTTFSTSFSTETNKIETPFEQHPNSELTEKSTFNKNLSLKDSDITELLDFFKLKTLTDIFEDSKCFNSGTNHLLNENSDDTVMIMSSPGSPILCTFQKTKQLKSKFKSETAISNHKLEANKRKPYHYPNKDYENKPTLIEASDFADLEDIFDLATFNIDFEEKDTNQQNLANCSETKTISISDTDRNNTDFQINNQHANETNINYTRNKIDNNEDFCDLSVFGLTGVPKKRLNDEINIMNSQKKKKLNDGTVETINNISKNCEPAHSCCNSTSQIKNIPQTSNYRSVGNTTSNVLKGPSQLTITQIVGLVGETPTPSAGVESKEPDYFKDLLDQM